MVLWVRFPEVPVTVITYVPAGVPEEPPGGLGLGFTDVPPPPQPTAIITSKNAGAAKAMRLRPVSLKASSNVPKPPSSMSNGIDGAGGLMPAGSDVPRAVVLMTT